MEDQIKFKIRRELDRGVLTEAQVVYLLVEIRKLIDRNAVAGDAFESLRLYSDWAVHIGLAGPQAQDIVKKADAFYPQLLNNSATPQEKTEFAQIFSLNCFRDQIERFLTEQVDYSFSDAEWNMFLSHYVGVIEDCPLFCKVDNARLTHVNEVLILPSADSRIRTDGRGPAIVWGLCFDGFLKFQVGANFEITDSLVDTLVDFTSMRQAITSAAQSS